MKKFISNLFLYCAVPFLKLSNFFSPHRRKKNHIQEERLRAWKKANGDETLRSRYPLNHDSVVFDLGGYEGQWAADIFCKYGSTVYIFEPLQPYCQVIERKFGSNTKIKRYCFGLGKTNEMLKIGILDDASSVFKSTDSATAEIEIKNVTEFIHANAISKIDLMKINIEGGEYDVLESLIENGLIGIIENIQIQFHDFVPDAKERMKKIQTKLQLTHRPTYQFEFVWENWEALSVK